MFFVGEGQLLAAGSSRLGGQRRSARVSSSRPAIQADVIDYDELHTGKRREAQYGALWSMMTKFAVIPSMSIPLAVLETLGYEPNVEQTATVKLAIRGMLALLPAACALARVRDRVLLPDQRGRAPPDLGGHRAPPARRGRGGPDHRRTALAARGRGVDEETGWFLDHFSPRELRGYVAGGAGRLVCGAALGAALCLAFAAGGGSSLAYTAATCRRIPASARCSRWSSPASRSPPRLPAVRLRAALRMRRRPVGEGRRWGATSRC